MSQSKVYVGNLSYDTTEDELRDFFSQYGTIVDVKLIMDFSTGRSKGFGFITYASDQDCENALAANGADLSGRKLKVNIAREDNRRPASNGGGFRRSNGAGAGNGGGRPSFRDRDDRGGNRYSRGDRE